MKHIHSERAVFVEMHRGVPHTVAVEEMSSWRHGEEPTPSIADHDVENCAEDDEVDLWHHDSGDTGGRLGRFCGRWRPGFELAEVWWASEEHRPTTSRPFVAWWLYSLPQRWLQLCRFKRWLERPAPEGESGLAARARWLLDLRRRPVPHRRRRRGWALRWLMHLERVRSDLPTWVEHGRATRFSLWRLGYRRIRRLPSWMPVDDPFAAMCEGDTVYCSECGRSYPTECGHTYQAFPAAVRDGDGWSQTYDVVEAAGAWLAARMLEDAAHSWGNDGYKAFPRSSGRDWRWEVESAFADRLEHEVDLEVDRDLGREPAGRHRVKVEKAIRASERFPDQVLAGIKRRARDLDDVASVEPVEHVCPHVWFEEGVGWTGTGYDC